MTIYICSTCNVYVFDEKEGDPSTGLGPGTKIEEIPADWECPICGAKKDKLRPLGSFWAKEKKLKYQERLAKKKKVVTVEKGGMTLVDVRAEALARMAGVCAVNPICDGAPDRLCQGQKYGGPIGMGGAGKGLSFEANVKALDRIRLKTRLISEHKEPDMSVELFERKLFIPIMASSLSGVKASMGGTISELDFATAVLKGCKEAGTLGLIGNTADEGQELCGIDAVKEVGLGIPVFKPQSNTRLLELMKMAEKAGAIAIGLDLDGVGSTNWERAGKALYRKSVSELSELAAATELPFIAKGIMSVEDALAALDARVDAIDVSNHGGRVLDSTRGVAWVLPDIAKAVGGKVPVTAGGGVRTGFDVLKMLALGADAVLIGRDIARAAIGGGPNGVKLHLDYLRSELRRAMLLTSCNSVEDIDEKVLEPMWMGKR